MKRHSFFERWGRVVAGPKTKWLTLILWIALAALLSAVAPGVNKVEDNNAANLPGSSPSVEAQHLVQKEFPKNDGTPALVVWYRKSGLTTDDYKSVQRVAAYLQTHPLQGQTSVAPLNQLPEKAVRNLTSSDGTTLVLPVSFATSTDSTTLQTSVKDLQSDVKQVMGTDPFPSALAAPGLHARVTGPVGIAVDAFGLFKNADFALLMATVLLVLILLIILYRSPVLAFVPLVAVGFAYGVISPLLGWLAKSGLIVVDAQGVSIMTVLLFGAGTDYCLFMVARFREQLLTERDKHKAIQTAVGGAAGAVAMSGLTVVVSLLALLFAKYGSDHRFAVPFSLAVFIMALAGVTLVPALLAIFGRGSFFPFVPRTPEMVLERVQAKGKTIKTPPRKRGRFGNTLGRVVAFRPWPVLTISAVVLMILAATATHIQFTYNLLESFPKTMASREGFTLLSQHYSPGTLAPVDVLVKDTAHTDAVKSALTKLPFAASVSQPEMGASGAVVEYQVTLREDPYTLDAMAQIPDIKNTVVHTLSSLGETQAASAVFIGGETATQYDTQQLTNADTKTVIPIVLGVITLLLLIYLRSVVATLYLIFSVILSYGAALGAGWFILHTFMGATAITGAIPLYAFVFLVALGEDYNIFMVSRIWQERRDRPLREAIAEGVSKTSGVITSAGLILAGTFAVLASLPIQILVQFGIISSIGVLLDTFIVRPFLVPALTSVLGRWAFWPGRADGNDARARMTR